MSDAAFYKKFIEERRAFYKKIGCIYCPALGEGVTFNSEGFFHLLHDSDGTPRLFQEKIYKLKLLSLVACVIRQARDIEGYTKSINTSGDSFEYWSLLGSAKDNTENIKVILRRRGKGGIFFHSVMKMRTKKPS